MKIDIISGFLGAGKTTFIKRLLNTRMKEEKVVLIENEFGEISVDSDFLADTRIDIKELSQGCICCSLFGDFSKSLQEVIEKYQPDRILIEPSGVGKLSDIIQAVKDAGLEKNLNALVCLVDVNKAKMYSKNFGEFFLDQIKTAHTIILSRTDVAKEDKVIETLEVIRENNDKAVLVTTPIQDLKDGELFKAYEGLHDDFIKELLQDVHHEHEEECCGHHHHHEHEEECCGHHHHHEHEEGCCGHHNHHEHEEECCGHHHHHEHEEECCGHHHHHEHEGECCGHHHHHHAEEVFSSVGFETVKKYNLEFLKTVLENLSNGVCGIVVRAKGVISDDTNQWYQFNLTPGEVTLEKCNPRPIGKICVIGSKIDEAVIKKLF